MSEKVYKLMNEGEGHTLRVMRYRLLERVATLLKSLTKNS